MPHKMTKSSGMADAETATHASPRRSIVARATKAVAKTRKAIGKVAGRSERPEAKAPSPSAVAGRAPQPTPAKAASRVVGPVRGAQKSATEMAPVAKGAAAKKVSSATKAVAKKVAPAKTVAVKTVPAKAPAKKAPAARAPVAKAPAKKAPAKKAPVAKAPAKKAPAKKAPAKKAPAKKSVATGAKSPARAASRIATKTVQTAERTARRAPGKAPAKGIARPAPPRTAPVRAPRKGYTEERFLNHQRNVLERERATYLEQANSLQEEADLLVAEMEPGDIQFDEESGEGGTVAVDRERDLTLSAQALEAVVEIEAALAKIGSGMYGVCEGCGELIPKPRLEALPYARLCMACKSGGLSRR
jgi:RNA polymerase-binding transcription factor DksA